MGQAVYWGKAKTNKYVRSCSLAFVPWYQLLRWNYWWNCSYIQLSAPRCNFGSFCRSSMHLVDSTLLDMFLFIDFLAIFNDYTRVILCSTICFFVSSFVGFFPLSSLSLSVISHCFQSFAFSSVLFWLLDIFRSWIVCLYASDARSDYCKSSSIHPCEKCSIGPKSLIGWELWSHLNSPYHFNQ